MFYLFACTECDKEVSTGDALLSREETTRPLRVTADRINAIECYIMNENDIVIWQSWPEEKR